MNHKGVPEETHSGGRAIPLPPQQRPLYCRQQLRSPAKAAVLPGSSSQTCAISVGPARFVPHRASAARLPPLPVPRRRGRRLRGAVLPSGGRGTNSSPCPRSPTRGQGHGGGAGEPGAAWGAPPCGTPALLSSVFRRVRRFRGVLSRGRGWN